MGMLAVSDDVLQDLEGLAVENNVTPGKQAEMMLREAIRQSRRVNRVEIARHIASMTPPGIVQSDSTQLIREDRDR